MGTDIHPKLFHKNTDGSFKEIVNIEPYERRDYTAFAILANVRNGFGFAGSYRHEPLPFIQEHRGLPEGLPRVSCKWHSEDGYEYGDHNRGYVTLQEIIDYDWDQDFCKGGSVQEKVYLEWKKSGEVQPSTWCGGAFGPNRVTVDEAEYNSDDFQREPGKEYYIQSTWVMPLRESVSYFLDWVSALQDTTCYFDPNDVYYVFGFDS